jgi:hypothetical protein
MSAATMKPIRLECYLPRLSGANKVSLFRADSLARYLLQCAWAASVVAVDKTVVSLNVATRSGNVYPDKCWFAVMCRFWLQLGSSLRELIAVYDKRTTRIQAVYLSTLPLTASSRINVDKFWQTNIPWTFPELGWNLFSLATGGLFSSQTVRYFNLLSLHCTLLHHKASFTRSGFRPAGK